MLLFGLPGSGKGTQGRALGCMPGFLHVASGDMFRQLSRLGQYGKLVDSYTSQGKLVPDELTIEIWRNHVSLLIKEGKFDPAQQIILLDGIPRTFRQAELLRGDIEVQKILYLKLQDDGEAFARILERAKREKRTDDTNEAVIRGRLEVFYRETAETLSYFDPHLIAEINASQQPMRVLADAAGELCSVCNSPVPAGMARG